jgi:hypothetical protein
VGSFVVGDQAVQRQAAGFGQFLHRQQVGRCHSAAQRICASRMKAGAKLK